MASEAPHPVFLRAIFCRSYAVNSGENKAIVLHQQMPFFELVKHFDAGNPLPLCLSNQPLVHDIHVMRYHPVPTPIVKTGPHLQQIRVLVCDESPRAVEAGADVGTANSWQSGQRHMHQQKDRQ